MEGKLTLPLCLLVVLLSHNQIFAADAIEKAKETKTEPVKNESTNETTKADDGKVPEIKMPASSEPEMRFDQMRVQFPILQANLSVVSLENEELKKQLAAVTGTMYYPRPDDEDCCKVDVLQALCDNKIENIVQDMVRIGGRVYYFSPNTLRLNWFDSQDFCRSHGMQLVSLETMTEETLIKNQINLLITSIPAQEGSFWTSLNDLNVENTYMWAGQGVAAFTPIFIPSLPNGASADCGEIKKLGATIRYNDQACLFKTRFICEMCCPCDDLITLV